MAENFKSDKPGEGHNGAPLSDDEKAALFCEVSEQLDDIEEEARKLSKKKSKIMSNMKQKTGVTIADFNAGRRLGSLKDEDEQQQKADNVVLVFNAISNAGQLKFDL